MDAGTECEGIGEILRSMKPGVFWDCGSNLGYYSLYAAKLGWEVYSWDLGKRAVELLNLSARQNRFKIVSHHQAFTAQLVRYRELHSAYAGNKVAEDPHGSVSMTWKEAAQKYPAPAFLKMDIEGAEMDFLKDDEFRQWITDKKITLFMEIHDLSSHYHLARWVNPVCFDSLCSHLLVRPRA